MASYKKVCDFIEKKVLPYYGSESVQFKENVMGTKLMECTFVQFIGSFPVPVHKKEKLASIAKVLNRKTNLKWTNVHAGFLINLNPDD